MSAVQNVPAWFASKPQFQDRDSKRDPAIIEKEPLSRLVAALLESRTSDRAAMTGLDDQRKDQIVAGRMRCPPFRKR